MITPPYKHPLAASNSVGGIQSTADNLSDMLRRWKAANPVLAKARDDSMNSTTLPPHVTSPPTSLPSRPPPAPAPSKPYKLSSAHAQRQKAHEKSVNALRFEAENRALALASNSDVSKAVVEAVRHDGHLARGV